MKNMHITTMRNDWSIEEIEAIFRSPFHALLFRAHATHREFHDEHTVQVSTLLSIKTGACPEDCAYCPQSAHYNTGLKVERLLAVDAVVEQAAEAKANGATRFCMGAAWRSPRDKDLAQVAEMVKGVKALGLETCATLGMLSETQARALSDAGLDYYNHNIDTSPEHYRAVIGTRDFQDRLDTLEAVRSAGMKVCCGGIVGMGETRRDRAGLLRALANMATHPESVPINQLVAVPGTPLADQAPLDPFEFVRTIAVARILMPKAMLRLSAGRMGMSDELQALCFFAGANSIFYGDKLLTTDNPEAERDKSLLARLDMRPAPAPPVQSAFHASIVAREVEAEALALDR